MDGQDFGLGLLISALALGLRHGIDWDHLAAIADISASQERPRRRAYLATLYALGHAGMVLVLGIVAIALGRSLPEWADAIMGRIVGWTLVLLGAYIVYSLVRHRGQFRMRSRWMLVLSAVRNGYVRIRAWAGSAREGQIEHEHEHATVPSFHHAGAGPTPESASDMRVPTHRHRHTHRLDEDPFADYTATSAIGIGVLHGIGAETPTQVLIFLGAANAGGTAAGIAVLLFFLVGLLAANSAITLITAFGFEAAGRRQRVYAVLGAVTAAISLTVGGLLIFGQDVLLPQFFAG